MPRPVYIILARIVVEDRTNGLVSIANVIEQIEIHRLPAAGASPEHVAATNVATLQAQENEAIAVWMRNESDADDRVFQHQFVIVTPENEARVADPEPFSFEPGKFLQRFKLTVRGVPLLDKSGIVEIESRVRAIGEDAWQSQKYPYSILVKTIDEPHKG